MTVHKTTKMIIAYHL